MHRTVAKYRLRANLRATTTPRGMAGTGFHQSRVVQRSANSARPWPFARYLSHKLHAPLSRSGWEDRRLGPGAGVPGETSWRGAGAVSIETTNTFPMLRYWICSDSGLPAQRTIQRCGMRARRYLSQYIGWGLDNDRTLACKAVSAIFDRRRTSIAPVPASNKCCP